MGNYIKQSNKINRNGHSSSHRCYCGRYITIQEEEAGIGVFGYTCPTCSHREFEERYKRLKK